MTEIKLLIRAIPDFPKKGILFRDITPVLKNPDAFKKVIDAFQRNVSVDIDKVVAIESRGFIFGSALAFNLGVGFVPVRKSGKLPGKTIKAKYDLEYGTDTLEIHEDAIEKGEKSFLWMTFLLQAAQRLHPAD
jgi:adenine phosphoribosyltransferase